MEPRSNRQKVLAEQLRKQNVIRFKGQEFLFNESNILAAVQALTDVSTKTRRLPQRHSDLWDLFKTIHNKQDEEEYEQLLP